MRRAKGKKLTANDREELAKFAEYLRTIADPPIEGAYAKVYGEVVFVSPDSGDEEGSEGR